MLFLYFSYRKFNDHNCYCHCSRFDNYYWYNYNYNSHDAKEKKKKQGENDESKYAIFFLFILVEEVIDINSCKSKDGKRWKRKRGGK